MISGGAGYSQCYTFHGDGDISAASAVQAHLREYGTCSYFNWDPRPPCWRFFYETNLTQIEVEQVLGSMLNRFNIVVVP
ncbi:MAG: hypothetical protein ACK2UY_15540 [Anaerolineae bacterium]|jgi:hypothetical protein